MRDPALLRDRAFRFQTDRQRFSSATRKARTAPRRPGRPSTRNPGGALSSGQPCRCCWPRHRWWVGGRYFENSNEARTTGRRQSGGDGRRPNGTGGRVRHEARRGGGRPCWGHRPGRGLQQEFDGLLLIHGAHVPLSGVLSDYGWRVVGLVRCPPAEIESWPSSLRGGASAGGGACPAPVASESAGHGCSRSGSTGAGCDAECGGGARPGRGFVLLQRLDGGGPGAVRAAGASRGGG